MSAPVAAPSASPLGSPVGEPAKVRRVRVKKAEAAPAPAEAAVAVKSPKISKKAAAAPAAKERKVRQRIQEGEATRDVVFKRKDGKEAKFRARVKAAKVAKAELPA